MIKCELQDDGTVDIRIKGPADDVNAEFCYILQSWAKAMEESTPASKQVHIWNACMIALGKDMTMKDIYEVSLATNENRFYAPKVRDGIPRDLWNLMVRR